MKSCLSSRFVAIVALCSLGVLTSCAQGSTQTPAEQTPSSYTDNVGPDGLINGKTISELSGEVAFECMQDLGWTSLVLGADGFSGNVPEEQGARYDSDLVVCFAEAEAAYPPVPMSERAIRERYALEVEARFCLIELGYAISEPPSEQAWVEQFNGGEGELLWLPYAEVFAQANITQSEEAELKTACPDPASRVYSE